MPAQPVFIGTGRKRTKDSVLFSCFSSAQATELTCGHQIIEPISARKRWSVISEMELRGREG